MTLSPQLAAASRSARADHDLRLVTLVRAGEAFYAARSRYHAYEGDDDREEEELCQACSNARLVFAQACERYFLTERPGTA